MERKDQEPKKEGFQLPFMAEPTSQNRPMERKDQEPKKEGFQLPFMAEPTSQNHPQNRRLLQINESTHLPSSSSYYSNPSFHQNPEPNFHYDVFVNPNSSPLSQTHPLPLPSQFPTHEGLEDAFRRMNINLSQSHNDNHQTFFNGSSSSNSAPLQRMRVESAVRGQQMGFYNEGLGGGGHLNSTIPHGAALPLARSANFLPTSTPIGNEFNLFQRRSQSFDELAYANRRLPMINSIDWGNNSGGTWNVNGLESQNPNFFYSMFDHHRHRPWSKYSSMEELKGRVSSVAKDQNGSRSLQKKFDNEIIMPEDIDMYLSEVKDQLHELMVHQFANYLIQKIFEAGNQQQRTELLLLLVTREQRFMEVCTDPHGTRGIQKIMEQIYSQEHRSILLSVLKRIAVTLTKNIHGHHIIERCFHKFSDEDTKHIVDEIAQHFLEIATDKSGCCVLQQCLSHAKSEARDRILAEITANAFILSEDRYGNYVVQYVVGMGLSHVTSNLIMQLRGCFVSLSTNKFGSNVVEKCLKYSGEDLSSMIIKEIMYHRDFVKVLQDAYGNYVVQSALLVSKGDLHKALVQFILNYYSVLHSHLYGKMVLDRIKCSKNRV